MKKNYRLFVSTARGCESALCDEIREACSLLQLSLPKPPEICAAGVEFDGTVEHVVALNLALTTASRLFITLKQCRVRTLDDVYRAALTIDWPREFELRHTFAVDATCSNSFCNNSMSLALKVKDAIADNFRKRFDERPNVDTRRPDVGITARLHQDLLTLSLDTSGETLSNHGYRKDGIEAPMRENLAATLVRHSGWNDVVKAVWAQDVPAVLARSGGNSESSERRLPSRMTLAANFLDPMCGSGTIGIEAALLLLGRKPNSRRGDFAFLRLNSLLAQGASEIFNATRERLWKLEKNEDDARQACQAYQKRHFENDGTTAYPVICRDAAHAALNTARAAAATAGVAGLMQFEASDFFNSTAPAAHGIMVANPPYDRRISTEISDTQFYKNIGNSLKGEFGGWLAWVFSANLDALKHLGLRPTRKLNLYSGQLPAQFLQYLVTPRRQEGAPPNNR